MVMPGDVSLARHGMRFLDERPQCRRHVLEVLRQPREKSIIYVRSRERAGLHGAECPGAAYGSARIAAGMRTYY